MSKPCFIVYENSSKGLVLALPFEAHTIQVVIARKNFLNYYKLGDIGDTEFVAWGRTNIVALSQMAWLLYDQGRFRERMVARSRVRQVDLEIDKFTGWALVAARRSTDPPGVA